MQVFRDKIFTGRATSDHCANLAFENCQFHSCHFPASFPKSFKPGSWHSIRNIELRDVGQQNCSLDTASLEDVTLHNLKRVGDAPLFLWGCVFRRVTVSGEISALKINRRIGATANDQSETQKIWDGAAIDFYRQSDWALDISAAKFGGGVTFEAIPGDLIRRDPKTQVLVKRASLDGSDWRRLNFDGTAIDIGLSWFLSGSLFGSVVLAARTSSKWRKRDLAVLGMLRREGVAEPN
jgi:uncharacterized protein YjbI with pentapeptide repeats